MQTPPSSTQLDTPQRRKRFSWMMAVPVSIVLIVIFVFVGVTLLILRSQGITQGTNTLTVISIVIGFVVSLLGLLVSYLQWHHPKVPPASEAPISPLVFQTSAPDDIEHSQSPNVLNGPLQAQIEQKKTTSPSVGQMSQHFDWGEASRIDQFYGRDQELTKLEQWIVEDSCRIVAILGMGGMGKTSLATILIDQVHEQYDHIFWRSLHNAPPLENIVQECIQFVSNQQQTILPEGVDRQIALLIEYLQARHCLLVLDNVESILQGGTQTGQYRERYEVYGRLFQRIGEARHQSCLLITSREKPKEVALLEGEATAVRSYHLAGLSLGPGQDILKDKGLQGTEHTWEVLISHYNGNPLALKLVAQVIKEVFGGDIVKFLQDGELLFRDIRDVLEQQIERLSALEKEIVYWLALEREAVALDALQENIVHAVSRGELQEALQSLRRRQLIETNTPGFVLHHVIMEYVTARFIDKVCEEFRTETMELLGSYALMKAQAKDYIRQSQCRLILQPLIQKLLTFFEKEDLEKRFQSLLATLQKQHDTSPSYAAGNVLNLLIQLGYSLRGYDLSYLRIRQAYFQGVALPDVNFAHADLGKSVFTDTFGSILCVALNQQGDLLMAGTATGEVRLWHATNGIPLQTFRGHTDWVWSVIFSPDGKTIASGSGDQTVRLWDVHTGQCLNILQGHTSAVYSVAFSPDGETLASGSEDRTVRLWEVRSGKSLSALQGHTGQIRSVAFSPDGMTLASCSFDRVIRLWEVSSSTCLNILQGHVEEIWSVAFSPDGETIASGSNDQTIRLWERRSGQCLNTLQGHVEEIWSVAFSPDGETIASGSSDQTIRLWERRSGQCLNTLQGHRMRVRSVAFGSSGKILASGSEDQTVRLWEVSSGKSLNALQGYSHWVRSVAFSPDGKTLASADEDRAARLWEVSSGKCITTLQGHSHWVYSVAFSPDGRILASGSSDRTIRLWDMSSGTCLSTLHGHTNTVSALAFSPDGRILASGSGDLTVCLWEVSSGKLLNILQGHTLWIWSVAFSPDGRTLASGGSDQTVRLWEVSSGTCFNVLQGHSHWIRSVAFSIDGGTLASGCYDRTIRLWKVKSGACLSTLHGHTNAVYSVAFSPDGEILASGSGDQTVRLWEVSSGKPLNILQGHNYWVWSVAFSPDGRILASCSYDGAINLWDWQVGVCLSTLRCDRPYERMNISHTKGLTEAQRTTFRLLGAIEDDKW